MSYANGDLRGRRPGNALDRRLGVLEKIHDGALRVRFNQKLFLEYETIIKTKRNDNIEAFFAIIDSEHAVRVSRNSLSKKLHDLATTKCKWPSHDQHLLAAAVTGDRPTIFTSEVKLSKCAGKILLHFDVHVEQLT